MLLLPTGVALLLLAELVLVGVVRTTVLPEEDFVVLFTELAGLLVLFLSLLTVLLPAMLELLESALLSDGVSSLREVDEVPMPLRLVFLFPASLSAPV